MEKFFFGIDGGGTQSRLAVSDENARVLYTVCGTSTNMYAVGFENSCAAISALFELLKKESGLNFSDFAAGCFASAGLSSEKEKNLFRAFFAEKTDCPVYVCSDALAALAGGTGKAEGIILISGTGSIAAAMHPDGRTARSGGLGHLIGDEGSGFRIGLDGIKAAVCASEDRGEKTLLTDMLFAHYGISDIRELFPFLYTHFDKARVASFSPLVFDAARHNDTAALCILDQAVCDLAMLVQSVYMRLFNGENTEAVFSGGILEHEAEFTGRIAVRLTHSLPQIVKRSRLFEPVRGACILALNMRRRKNVKTTDT